MIPSLSASGERRRFTPASPHKFHSISILTR